MIAFARKKTREDVCCEDDEGEFFFPSFFADVMDFFHFC